MMMKVRLLKAARVQVPAGVEIELPDSQARLYIKAGLAVKPEERPIEKAVQAPAETAEKKAPAKKRTKKKEE